ncbi:MAG: hypothetical protein HKL84_09745 [Acidimicrobiaceae bacterium]|nr:hypothetical protein [Acidimicrobiaceae bacterium]
MIDPKVQNAPPIAHKILGLDRSTFVTSIVVPVIIAILTIALTAWLTVWLTAKWRDRLRVKVMRKLSHQQFEELSALYCERIPDYERVPPNHLQAFLRRQHSAKSLHDFKRRLNRSTDPVHLLFVARTASGICGFLKAIYIPEVRSLFIAYLVTSKGADYEERTVSRQLLSRLFRACHGTVIQQVVYEICAARGANYQAKARLFQHHATAFGIKLRKIDAKYQQPEICSFDAGDCKLTTAALYIAHLGSEAERTWHSMSRDQYEKLVSSIYKNVYLMSYALAEPQLTEKYRDFLHNVAKELFAGIRTKTIELR